MALSELKEFLGEKEITVLETIQRNSDGGIWLVQQNSIVNIIKYSVSIPKLESEYRFLQECQKEDNVISNVIRCGHFQNINNVVAILELKYFRNKDLRDYATRHKTRSPRIDQKAARVITYQLLVGL